VVVPGVYRDLRGLYVLRKPSIPSVIIESHNALDPHEVARWAEPGVAETFAAALEVALAELRDTAP
jgi:N-acetylmuramoyl-L-alanine amidase